jgi:glutathione S-transferase
VQVSEATGRTGSGWRPNAVDVVAVAWALKVKGADYEFVNVEFGGDLIKSDEFKAWNPNALVPVVRDGEFSLFEG